MKLTQPLIFFFLLIGSGLLAQVPAGINFQGTARDDMGAVLANQPVDVTLHIIDANTDEVDYTETHNLTTDDIGLYSFLIGTGTDNVGNFDDIDWSINRNMEVEMDFGNTGTTDIQFTTPLNAVPYALYAKNVENADDADADPANEIQQIAINGREITLSNGGSIMLPTDAVNDADADPSNELQQLSLSGKELTLSNGGAVTLPPDEVNDADADPNNEIQQISLSGNEVTLSNGGSFALPTDQVNDPDADPSNEIQQLSISGREINLSGGGSVTIPNDADADPTNEIQQLSINGNQLTLSGGGTVSIPTGGTDADADPTNEIQQISINGNQVTLSGGGTITLPTDNVNDADSNPTNEIQTISINGRTISLSSGGTVTLPADQVNDADANATNEIQQLSLTNDQLTISNGNAVDLSKYNVAYGDKETDVPTTPFNGQLYFDEVCNSLFIYHMEGWTEVPLGSTVMNIYDKDMDGITNSMDNCPETYNPMQLDTDMDGVGDVCDTLSVADRDSDGIGDDTDNCPDTSNADQADSDNDGVGNVCDNCPNTSNPNQEDADNDGQGDVCDNGLHPAFAEFDSDSYTIYLDGSQVVLETDGLPNHTSPYWSNTTQRCLTDPRGNEICTNENTTVNHPLFTAPTATSFNVMAPGNIDDFNGSYTLRVPVDPQLANRSTATGLGAIGMAVSGSVIYNDEEGPNIPLDNAVGSLDYTAAHTGPQSYHYHLEPKAWSDDDGKLIGIMADGFFLYGRRDYDGSYPTNLDNSGGHFGPTPHNPNGEYHYHIKNELYLNQYYILFPEDYQGTPGSIR